MESRRVDNFEKLCELLICDRLKSVLPEGCLRYVLSIESSKDPSWLDLRALTEAIDRYADIWCAVVPDLHGDFILTADAVSPLSQSDANIARVTTRNDGDSNDDTDCDTAAATVNTDDVDVVVTSVSDDENNVPVVQSEINHDTLDVGDTDTRRRDANDDNDDDDAITECNDDKSSLASCSEVAQEQRNDKSLSAVLNWPSAIELVL